MRLFVNTLAAIMLVVSLSFTGSAQAQDDDCTDTSCAVEENPTPTFDPATYTRHRLPSGRRCMIDGESFQCFSLSEYIQLLEMDVDLQFYDAAYPIAERMIATLEGINTQLTISLDATAAQVDILSAERTRLIAKWTEENRLRLEAENKPLFGSWLAWGVAAAEAAVIVFLSVILGLAL